MTAIRSTSPSWSKSPIPFTSVPFTGRPDAAVASTEAGKALVAEDDGPPRRVVVASAHQRQRSMSPSPSRSAGMKFAFSLELVPGIAMLRLSSAKPNAPLPKSICSPARATQPVHLAVAVQVHQRQWERAVLPPRMTLVAEKLRAPGVEDVPPPSPAAVLVRHGEIDLPVLVAVVVEVDLALRSSCRRRA